MTATTPLSSFVATLWPTVKPDHSGNDGEEHQPREDFRQDVEDQNHSGTVLQGLPVEVQH